MTDQVATITLNRPDKRNAQNPHTWHWLSRVRDSLPATVRVVVLRGAGRAFSAGLDRAMFTAEGIEGAPGVLALASGDPAAASAQIAAWQGAFDWISRPSVVSIAAVQGHAIGAGFQLALGTDIRIIAEDAQFTMAEPSLGLVPDLGGTKRLVDLVGYSRAAEICLTGRRVGAQEASSIGLASVLVPAGELDDAVQRTVTSLLAVDRDASAETKALLMTAARASQAEQEAAERDAQYRRLRALVGLEAEA
ncbi:MAG: enoyl-CoA hydratase/isomerase family protein [Actinomycetota bacterium]|nr:enoyl-CoA hydratase/isomerase family protein [Actinomycetota bacterium]